MTIKQLMNSIIDTSTELLEAHLDDHADDTIVPYYIGKLDAQIGILKHALTEREIMTEEI